MSAAPWLAPDPLDSPPRPIDPLSVGLPGEYCDDLVHVRKLPRGHDAEPATVVTSHFRLRREGGRLQLTHSLPKHRIDNDLVELLSAELFRPGWVSGPETFERLLTGIVLSSAASPLASWELFYRNTLRRLEILHHQSSHNAHGCIAGFAPVYRRACELAAGSVLEIASCFGFLSVQLAQRGHDVTATDLSAGSVRLLSAIAPELGVPLSTLTCDGARVPRPDASVDVVLVVHLLEHLTAAHGMTVVDEAVWLARRRVVIAVPYEDEPDVAFGHVRVLTPQALTQLGEVPGWQATVSEHHGGWLVLDRL